MSLGATAITTVSPAELAEDEVYESYPAGIDEGGPRRLRYVAPVVKPEFTTPDPLALYEQPNPVTVVDEQDKVDKRVLRPAVWRRPDAPKDAFHALQRWEGVVSAIEEETFVARLTDLTSEGPDEEVELPLADVPSEDRDLLEAGAVFYWAIGYRDEASGQRQRVSALRFRRLPVWSAGELRAARERVAEVAAALGVEGGPGFQLDTG